MPNLRRQLTIEWIDSPACDWPPTIKERGKAIIHLTAALTAQRHRLGDLEMWEAAKIGEMEKIARIHQRLANEYRNMGKELVYHLARFVKTRIKDIEAKRQPDYPE